MVVILCARARARVCVWVGVCTVHMARRPEHGVLCANSVCAKVHVHDLFACVNMRMDRLANLFQVRLILKVAQEPMVCARACVSARVCVSVCVCVCEAQERIMWSIEEARQW